MEQDSSKKISHIYHSTFCQSAGDCCTRNHSVLILCAALLGIPEAITSTLGALSYFGFILIPLGFILARYVGASKSLAFERFLQAFCALTIGVMIWLFPAISRGPFVILVVIMYLVVSISSSMTFPLQKALTNRQTLPVYLATCSYISNGTSFLMSLAVTWYLKSHNDLRFLGFLIIFGAVLHLFSGITYFTMGDIQQIREESQAPLIGNLREAIRDKAIRRLVIAGTITDLFLIMVPPVCILAVRNGAGCTPSQLMFFNTVTICSAITATWLYKQISLRFGPRRCLISTAPLLVVMSVFWWIIPHDAPWLCFILPFVFNGASSIFISTTQANYFTVTAPPHLIVPGTILIFLTNGALAGILGMILNPLLYKIIWALPEATPMTHYRYFLSAGALLFIIAFPCLLMLPKDTPKKTDSGDFQ